MRIVSLVPSLTEYLFDIGLGPNVVGVTKFCIHPKEAKSSAQQIGGTKDIKVGFIKELQPDIVIASKEENVKEQIEELERFTEVFLTDIQTITDAFTVMHSLASRTGRLKEAEPFLNQLEEMQHNFFPPTHKSVLYFIWRKPYMSVGTDTFIHSMIEYAGFENVIKLDRYPVIEPELKLETEPDFIFLSSEPYPFKEQHIQELQQFYPNSRVELVDGEMFSWYGSRVCKSFQYLSQLRKDLNIA